MLEVGGAQITCNAVEEGQSKAKWTVLNKEGKAEKAGPTLKLIVATWGKCQVKTKTIKEAEATIGECEMEIKQPQEQAKGLVRIVKGCTINTVLCEIKVTPQSEALETIETAENGENGEDAGLDPAFTGVSTEVSKGCSSDNIQSTSKGSMVGIWDTALLLVRGEPLEFRATTRPDPAHLSGMGKAEVTFKREFGTGADKLENLVVILGERASFMINMTEFNTCSRTMMYMAGQSCKFDVERVMSGVIGISVVQPLTPRLLSTVNILGLPE